MCELVATLLDKGKGIAGGVITGTEWELPTASSAGITGQIYPMAKGCEQHKVGLEATLYVQHSAAWACTCSGASTVHLQWRSSVLSTVETSGQGHLHTVVNIHLHTLRESIHKTIQKHIY